MEDRTAMSGQARCAGAGPNPLQKIAEEITDSLKSKDLTVQEAIWALDRARDLLMQTKVI